MAQAINLSQVVFRLSSGEIAGEINLKPEAWRFLARVNGLRSVADIAQNVGMDEATATRVAETLYQAGILAVAEGSITPPRPSVNGAFFDRVERELARAMGPLATIIVEDEVSALGEKREQFPRERVAELVERVSEAIRDDSRRMQFQQIMLEAIRKM